MALTFYELRFLFRIVFPFIILICSAKTSAQITQPYRYERTQKGSEDYFTIVPLKEEGLALLRHKDKYNNSKRVWELVMLDTTLREIKTTEFEVENRYNLVGHENTHGEIYFLYRTG